MNAPAKYSDFRTPVTEGSDGRRLFHALLSEGEAALTRTMAWDALGQEIVRANRRRMEENSTGIRRLCSLAQMLDWCQTVREQHAVDIAVVAQTLDSRGWQLLLRQYTPIAVTEGSWLQYAFGPLRSHTACSAALLRAHSLYAGYGSWTANAGRRFLDALHSLGIAPPSVTTWAFANDEQIVASVWREPAVTLALSEFSDTYLPEILGYNLFRAVYGLCPLVGAAERFLREQGAATAYWKFHNSNTLRQQRVDAATDAINAYLNAEGTEGRDTERIGTGLALADMLTAHWLSVIRSIVGEDGVSARGQMLQLIERKALHAFGYHRQQRLRGHTVDEYLDPQHLDSAALLDQLASSPYVRPGDAARSPFLTKLVQFGGPMFRIFTPAELDTIAAWIDSLPTPVMPPSERHDERNRSVAGHGPATAAAGEQQQPVVEARSTRGLSVRELYYRLLNVDAYPEALEAGRQFAADWLVRAGAGLGSDDRGLPFKSYSAAALKAWLDAKHREQVDSYSGESGAMTQSREEVVHQSVQLCPMVFIDGGWLQRFSSIISCGTEIGALLYQIYADELGNGSVVENHPNVYRELMAQMGVKLPEFGSRDFAFWSGFDDDAFEVPTFWLSISRYPRRFFPELLGLNLAMELSGVGGSYRQGRDLLRKYGYSSAFVDLHNTIDNVSTGHTAMALQAITLHMDAVASYSVKPVVDGEWRRIWTGYRALKPPVGIRGTLRLAQRRAAMLFARA